MSIAVLNSNQRIYRNSNTVSRQISFSKCHWQSCYGEIISMVAECIAKILVFHFGFSRKALGKVVSLVLNSFLRGKPSPLYKLSESLVRFTTLLNFWI